MADEIASAAAIAAPAQAGVIAKAAVSAAPNEAAAIVASVTVTVPSAALQIATGAIQAGANLTLVATAAEQGLIKAGAGGTYALKLVGTIVQTSNSDLLSASLSLPDSTTAAVKAPVNSVIVTENTKSNFTITTRVTTTFDAGTKSVSSGI